MSILSIYLFLILFILFLLIIIYTMIYNPKELFDIVVGLLMGLALIGGILALLTVIFDRYLE